MSGERSFSLEGPDSWMAVHAAARVLKSRLVVGMTVALRVAEMAALMSSVGGRLACSSTLPPN